MKPFFNFQTFNFCLYFFTKEVIISSIVNFANIVNNAPVNGLGETIAANNNCNVFRKDEVVDFEDKEALLSNAPEQERNMFKIPKVIQ